MAEILLDSDVIIAWLRGYEEVAGAIVTLLGSGHNLLWTPVSIAEIFAGTRNAESKRIETLFLILETLPVSAAIGRRAGKYMQRYARSHSVELRDALIGAAASESGLPLWTLNKKHYPMPDVRLYHP